MTRNADTGGRFGAFTVAELQHLYAALLDAGPRLDSLFLIPALRAEAGAALDERVSLNDSSKAES
jgi:hypothetical protein